MLGAGGSGNQELRIAGWEQILDFRFRFSIFPFSSFDFRLAISDFQSRLSNYQKQVFV
jgi:hypothetical protein